MEPDRLKLQDSAAAWLQKRELGPWNESDQADLTRWLEVSTANRVAFLRVEAAWEEMARLKAVASGFARRTVPTAEQLQLTSSAGAGGICVPPLNKRRLTIRWGVAACVLCVIGAAGILHTQFIAPSYRTPVGGLTSIPLKDGSSITLNTDSRVRIRLSDAQRQVELMQGEAFFDVAKDPERPFIVTSGNKRITVLGTAFSVRREGEDVRVLVTEGKVKIETTVLAAGSAARAGVSGVAVQQTPLPELEDTLSWRSGYLTFHDTALADVVAEFNRYNERGMAIEDPAIEAIQLTGRFRSTNVDALVRLLKKSYRIDARRDGDRIFLSGASRASE